MQHFVLAIIETKRVPSRVFVAFARVKILVRVASKVSQSFSFILHGMRMNNVHNDCNAIGMCFIDKFFKLFRCTKARAGCKKRTYMIAKTPIIGVFLNCHNLNSIVAFFYYSWQYVLFKFNISTNFLSILPHSDVAFVNKKWRFVWLKGLMFPLIFFFKTPYLS